MNYRVKKPGHKGPNSLDPSLRNRRSLRRGQKIRSFRNPILNHRLPRSRTNGSGVAASSELSGSRLDPISMAGSHLIAAPFAPAA
jgi:hypothetical protein